MISFSSSFSVTLTEKVECFLHFGGILIVQVFRHAIGLTPTAFVSQTMKLIGDE